MCVTKILLKLPAASIRLPPTSTCYAMMAPSQSNRGWRDPFQYVWRTYNQEAETASAIGEASVVKQLQEKIEHIAAEHLRNLLQIVRASGGKGLPTTSTARHGVHLPSSLRRTTAAGPATTNL